MDNNKLTMAWYNYDTKQYDYLNDAPSTDEEALHYIPNNPAAHDIYMIYREDGKTITQSMINALSACVGEPPRFPLSDEIDAK